MSERVRYRRHMTLIVSPPVEADYDEWSVKVVENMLAWELSVRPIVDKLTERGDARAAGVVEAVGLTMSSAARRLAELLLPSGPPVHSDVG